MQHLSTAFLIFALVIAVNQDGVKAQAVDLNEGFDQVAEEAKHRAVTIVDNPKYVAPPPSANTTLKPEPTPPSKPPITPTPDKHNKPKYVDRPRVYYGQIQKLPPHRHYNNKLIIQPPTTVFKYHKVVPLHQVRGQTAPKHQQLTYAASTSKPSIINNKSPKFSLPVETVNGIRADFVRPPPHFFNISTTTSTTTTAPTTTTKYIRTKRIWPQHVLNRMNGTSTNSSASSNDNKNNTSEDLSGSASQKIVRYVYTNERGGVSSTAAPSTKGPYRRVTRVPKKKTTTPEPANYTRFEQNDWVPIIPSHYTINKVRKIKQTPIISKRSDVIYNTQSYDNKSISKSFQDIYNQRMLFLQSFGLIPMASSPNSVYGKKDIIVVGKNKKPNVSGYRKKPVQTSHVIREYPFDMADPKIITRIKHHHHHHHHKYVKTVEKPVRVEVPKPVPVPVPMPVPVRVEQKVPYPVQVKVPHPVPVKVVEKEYVPKPYPVVRHVPVPVVKHVEVKVPQPYPVHVEKRVPYPVEVQVPVDKPYPVPVPVEKRVPVPVPVRVMVPQPYPVETKVPYPVQVKEPVEVIKHVPVKIPYPEPYPVRVPVRIPFPVEKKVPFPIEVEKKIPVPYPVKVPQKVEVERKVPVFIPRPMPFEKKVPVAVRVPYPVRVPIKVPYGVPILVHPSPTDTLEQQSIQNAYNNDVVSHYAYSVNGDSVTQHPQNTVTLHGNGAKSSVTVRGKPNFSGFQSRIDNFEETTTSNPVTTPDSTTNSEFLIMVTTTETRTETTGTQSLSEDSLTTKQSDNNNSTTTTTTTVASR